jgi:hypothetical protein
MEPNQMKEEEEPENSKNRKKVRGEKIESRYEGVQFLKCKIWSR